MTEKIHLKAFEIDSKQLESAVNDVFNILREKHKLPAHGTTFVLEHAADYLKKLYGITIEGHTFVKEEPADGPMND